ncbi:MAG: redoxin domain-containing protein [Terriglobales bacterium]
MAKERVRGVLDGGALSMGDTAPDFELPALIGGVRKIFRLSDYRGKTVVLAFYPFNWQEASVRQMVGYQAQRTRVLASNAETVAINVESLMNTTAWERESGPFDFPLCSDFWPHGEVCARYRVLRESGPGAGASARAIFIVDREGRVAFRKIFGWDEIPLLDEVFPLLEKV